MAYFGKLRALTQFANSHLANSAPWTVEAGVTGLSKAYIFVGSEQWPFKRTEVVRRATISGEDEKQSKEFLLNFFSAVFEATGYVRPEGLHHFPPDAPH